MAKDPANQEQDWKHYMRIFMGAAANLPDNEKGQTYPESYVKMDEEATKNLYPCLDVAGYNYYEDRYETLHRLHPERVLLGTEDHAVTMLAGYDAVCKGTSLCDRRLRVDAAGSSGGSKLRQSLL